jgi:hypothetical protein
MGLARARVQQRAPEGFLSQCRYYLFASDFAASSTFEKYDKSKGTAMFSSLHLSFFFSLF